MFDELRQPVQSEQVANVRTDLEACAMTADPESLITSLRKIEEFCPNGSKRNWKQKIGWCTHPSDEVRFRAIRQAFGLKSE